MRDRSTTRLDLVDERITTRPDRLRSFSLNPKFARSASPQGVAHLVQRRAHRLRRILISFLTGGRMTVPSQESSETGNACRPPEILPVGIRKTSDYEAGRRQLSAFLSNHYGLGAGHSLRRSGLFQGAVYRRARRGQARD